MTISKPGLAAATGHAESLNNSYVPKNLEVGKDVSVSGSISVVGGSTFNGNLMVDGILEVGGGVTFTGDLVVTGNMTSNNAYFYGTANTQINTANTLIPFLAGVTIGDCWDTGSSFFIAPTSGVYEFNHTVLCNLPTTSSSVQCIYYVGNDGAVPTTSATTKSVLFYPSRAGNTADALYYSPNVGRYAVRLQENQTVALFTGVMSTSTYVYSSYGYFSAKYIG